MSQTKYDAKRDQILHVVAELFAAKSYHGTGIAEIGDAVGLGRGALYRYIGSKETLLYEISSRQLNRMNEVADELAVTEPDPEKRLGCLAEALLRNIAEHRSEWTVFFREFHALTGSWREEVLAGRERYEAHWRDTINEGIRAGRFRRVSPVVVKGILGMFNYSYLWLTPSGNETPEQIASEFVDVVISGLRTG
ncbi:MAG: TetR/AcrR family transcriptional regulator [Mycobacterium sp.]